MRIVRLHKVLLCIMRPLYYYEQRVEHFAAFQLLYNDDTFQFTYLLDKDVLRNQVALYSGFSSF